MASLALNSGIPSANVSASAISGYITSATAARTALTATLGATVLTIAFGLIGTFSALGQKPAAVLRHL